ncbi:MAG: GTA-gp10 family protein [Sphingorhabdus sp.]
MSRVANKARGEALVAGFLLRRTFAALVAAEEELGPLFALVERAAAGQLKLAEMAGLFWHCRFEAPVGVTREGFCEAVVAEGLAVATPALKTLLGQILAGR